MWKMLDTVSVFFCLSLYAVKEHTVKCVLLPPCFFLGSFIILEEAIYNVF